ncbi:MAG: hypothetical protein L6R42_003739 [Xanthoria sp. 1 TBL-2021]|nr:MAG: hypothetical protein L6R42_003739 [Xanthoria sp. 1 TBL-2021]
MQPFETGLSGSFGRGLCLSDSPADDAAAWMQNRLDGTYHPALNTDDPCIFYNKEKARFDLLSDAAKPNLQTIYQEAEDRKRSFIKTVDGYNADARRYGSMEMDLCAEHTWDEVLFVQQRISQERDVETSKGFRGFCRTRLRRFADNSESFQSWLKLLPTGSQYLSVLCGGLTLVLGAAHRMADIRESISDIVDGIPSTLSKAKQYLNIFADSPELHACSADLYVAILDTLDAIVRDYQKHVARRLSSAVFRQNLSGKGLQDKIKLVDHCANRLTVQAEINFMQRQQVMYEGEKDMTRLMISSARHQDHGFNTLAMYHQDLSETFQHQGSKIEAMAESQRRLESMAESLNQQLNFLKASPLPPAESVRDRKLLESGHPALTFSDNHSRPPSPNTAVEPEEYSKQLKTVLSRLDIDRETDVASSDTATQLRLSHTLSLPSQDRAVALIMSPRLQTWLTSTTSSILLVNGQMFSNEDEVRQSPLSYFCAKLIDNVLNRSWQAGVEAAYQHLGVRWFCGLHTNMRTDADAHPPGMLNSILSQLIHQILDFLPRVILEDVSVFDKDLDLGNLNNIFDRLVRALPAGTILFCILDGISYYEDTEREDECMEVLSMLTNLTRRCQEMIYGPTVKLMITAPLRSHLVHRLLREEEILNLETIYPSNGGFSVLQWDLRMGGVIEN